MVIKFEQGNWLMIIILMIYDLLLSKSIHMAINYISFLQYYFKYHFFFVYYAIYFLYTLTIMYKYLTFPTLFLE